MNGVEDLTHGVQLVTFDGLESDPRTRYYEVRVKGNVAWRRKALPGTDQPTHVTLATQQRREALHLVAIEEALERERRALTL